MAHDTATQPASGVAMVLGAALAFSLSGPLAKSMIDVGWTAGSAVTVRVLVAAAVLAVPAAVTLRGRWHVVRSNLGLLVAYGTIAVAGCQLAYFSAVTYLQVGVALLIEFTAPVAVLMWMWWRHGQRPSRLTVLGAATAIVGLVLVIDLTTGSGLDPIGLLWALASMISAAFYWIVSAHQDNGLPGIVLAAGGLGIGGLTLLLAAAVGIVPFTVATADVTLADTALPWWLAVLVLGTVTAALAYTLGIVATRKVGSRLGSFVGLSEAVFGVVLAWLLLGEAPRAVQLLGGGLILLGVVGVKLGEPRVDAGVSATTAP